MKLSTRTRYGTRALVELALAYPDRVVPVAEMARKQNLSFKYLEQIMTPLRRGGLVVGISGPGGGYRLTRAPETVTLAEVFELLDEATAFAPCVDEAERCEVHANCATRDTWVELAQAFKDILGRTTLQELVDRKRSREEHAVEGEPACSDR